MNTTDNDHVLVFDTTLRDGEQSPGYSLNPQQKLQMARALADLNVDIIEAGFAAASPGDFASVQQVAREIQGPVICSLARASAGDIAAAGQAIEPAARKRIHVFLATSPVHREFKLRMNREQVLEAAVKSIHEARQWTDDVEFSAEDAIRTERDFLTEVIAAVVEAGATTVNIPDTVGYTTPTEIRDLFTHLSTHVPNIHRVILSTHCHNDLGMAVANSLAALEGGARQIECTINGIGERAGNCSLEEAVMALKVRESYFHFKTGVDTTRLYNASKLLCTLTGNAIARNKPVVGQNAFAHEAGIHQHGVLANKETYEIMRPADVGIPDSSLVLGKHSGKHALKARAEALGYPLGDNQLKSVFVAFKTLADTKKEVTDADLEELICGTEETDTPFWSVADIHVNSGMGSDAQCHAVVKMTGTDGSEHREAAISARPEEAVFHAICNATGYSMMLNALALQSDGLGEASQCTAKAELAHRGRIIEVCGQGGNMLEACAQAFVTAANQMVRRDRVASGPSSFQQAPARSEAVMA